MRGTLGLTLGQLVSAPFMWRAFAAGSAVGLAAPVLGSFLVQRRLSLFGDGVGHLAFAGVAFGVLLGISPVWGALGLALLGALALEWLRVRGRLTGDLSLALIFYLGLAIGVVVLSAIGRYDASVLGFLTGSILVLSWGDVAVVVVFAAVAAGLALVFYRQLLAVALDEDMARARGLPVDALNLMFVALVAILVAGGMRTVGLLLVAALLVVPVAAASRLSHSFAGAVARGAVIGLLSTWLGLLGSWFADTAPGGTIVLASVALFIAATLIGRRTAAGHAPARRAVR